MVAQELRAGTLTERWRACAEWYPTFRAEVHATLRERFAAVFDS